MRPRFIYGFVTPLRRLALLVLEESPPRHRVRAVFTSGETLDRATRLLLREAFGGPVFDVYGATEVGTFAWECECHDGLHVGEDIILCEFIPLPGNPFSQLVITSLKNRVMPLIRYAIGDLAVAGPAQPCACGRTFHRIARLEGRLIDCIHRPDGELVTPYAIETAMENVPGIRRFQVIQEEPAAMTVRVQGDQDAAIVDGVRAALRPLMGPIARLQVAFAPSLDPPLGQKFRLIECRLPKPEAE
jgi:phenylacetate-CoA ligase